MTPADDATARTLRQAFSSLDEDPAAASGCPPTDQIWMAVMGELPQRHTSDVILHTAACPACADAWRRAHDARLALQSAGDLPARRPAAWRSAWVWGPGLAAAALLLIGVFIEPLFDLSRRGNSPTYRQDSGRAIRPLIPDGAALDRRDMMLRWSPGPEGSRYNLRLTTEDLTVVDRAWSLDSPEYRIPPSTVQSLPSGSKLLWQVDVISPDQARHTSPTFIVRLR